MSEKWRVVDGYAGLYEVSDAGRVRRVADRYDAITSKEVCRVLTPKRAGHGYQTVCLCHKGKHEYCYIHRLVASAFLPNPGNLCDVNHKDGDKRNNVVDNLEWMSRAQNQLHRARVLGIGVGESNGSAKITKETALEIRRLCAEGKYTLAEIAAMVGVKSSMVGDIARASTWSHLGEPILSRKQIPPRSHKLTAKAADAIRRIYDGGGVTIKALASQYGVSFQMISRIVRGESWKTA